MTTFGYARVSSDDQDTSIQVNALRAAGCEIIRQEKRSGTKLDGRDELRTLLDFIRKDDVLVVTRLDRLARSLPDLFDIARELERKGAHLRVLQQNIETQTPTGRFFFSVLGAVAQFETDLRRERQLEGIARAKAAGKYRGRPQKYDPALAQTLLAQGKRKADIAREIGCSEMTVYRLLKEASA
jgi:DNA invertase Pin-like site-specific DNA recombinase